MVGKLFISLTILWSLIEPFNALSGSGSSNHPEDDRVNYNQNAPNPKNDNHIPADDYPLYWHHKNAKYNKNDNVIIVEPTITYSSRAEYQSNQPVQSIFKPSPPDSGFRPTAVQTGQSGSYYPYYVRASSTSYDRNAPNVNEVRRNVEQNRVLDHSDPSYQRFVPRNYQRDSTTHIEDQDNQQRKYYYQTTQTTDSRPPPPQPNISSKSSVRFYYPNGTEIHTYYNSDNQQVMDLYPNQYVLQLAETTTSTTTTRPVTRRTPITTTTSPIYWRPEVDCPPFAPCNTIVYQPSTQCCQCYLVPNRCCSCNYNTNTNTHRSQRNLVY